MNQLNDYGINYSGMYLIESPLFTYSKTPARHHKKKRIQKKWLKKYGYKKIITPKDKIYTFGNKIIAHPEIIKLIKEQLKGVV